MLLIPAIDLKDGHCVRLRQGRMDDATVYSTDPVSVADRWVKAGAQRLHIVDLNGAFAGQPVNAGAIRRIVEAHPDLPVQVGGGIRDDETIETYLNAGVRYVILGTKAVRDPHQVNDFCLNFPGHIMVGLDSRNGRVAVEGWSKLSRHDVVDLAQHFERDGVEAIIHTDISCDGMLQGMNLESTVSLAQSVAIPVIASGGVTNLNDIRSLCERRNDGISGAILGRALYENTIDFGQALEVVKRFDEGG